MAFARSSSKLLEDAVAFGAATRGSLVTMQHTRSVCVALFAALGLACSAGSGSHVITPVAASPPPKDDGKPAQGGTGGSGHAAALEELRIAPVGPRVDKQSSVKIPLPDAEHWTRVKFWGVPSLVGFRYGKEHHAIVAGVITHVEDNTAPGACEKSFEKLAGPLVEAFEVDVDREEPRIVPWNGTNADIEVVLAKSATLVARDTYGVTYGIYPAWGKRACLIVGVAVPSRDEDERAIQVRDRFAREILPKVEVTATEEPPDRF
jgi:hypothetical protein